MVSNVVENILSDWNSESSCNSESGKNQEVLISSKIENHNGSKKSSDDEGFSSSSGAVFLDSNRRRSNEKVERGETHCLPTLRLCICQTDS